MRYERYKGGPYWALYDEDNQMISVCVYKRGVIEIMKRILRLQGLDDVRIGETLEKDEAAYKGSRTIDPLTASVAAQPFELVFVDDLQY